MKLTFYGAAKQVTGSNFLLETDSPSATAKAGQASLGSTRILVDCGLHQGGNFCEKHNFDPFPYDPKEISAVLITHPHVDHVGRLPKLYKDGFRGKVYSTIPAKDFANLLLLDSEHILMQDAEKFKKPYLYGVREIEELMTHWEGVEYHTPIKIGPPAGGFTATFYNAGHILGSSFILVEGPSTGSGRPVRVVFSGDLGNSPAPIIGAREELPAGIDYAVMESTYGNRIHEPASKRRDAVEDAIEDVVKSGGVLMIPAFAMERTQQLLYEINELAENGRIPKVPIFLDSPLAIKLTEVYNRHEKYWDKESMKQIKMGDKLFNFPGLKTTLTTEESKAINEVRPPKVIIAGAGMSNAGRILHHEKRYLSDPNSTLLIVGYQSQGSLGRQILDGKKSGNPFRVKIHREEISVKASVKAVSAYSAHADQPQLLSWLQSARLSLRRVFLVHGEPDQMDPLAQKIKDELAVAAEAPEEGASYGL